MTDLLDRLSAAGFTVELTDSGPRLLPMRSNLRLPPELLAEVKANRDAVVEHLKAPDRPPTLSDADFCMDCARPYIPAAGTDPTARSVCPSCARPVDEKRRCWHCGNRPCESGCGHMTGSAYIANCDVCGSGGTYE
jgi:hypothetical protein